MVCSAKRDALPKGRIEPGEGELIRNVEYVLELYKPILCANINQAT